MGDKSGFAFGYGVTRRRNKSAFAFGYDVTRRRNKSAFANTLWSSAIDRSTDKIYRFQEKSQRLSAEKLSFDSRPLRALSQ